MSVTQPKGEGEGGGGASIDSLCKELTNRRKSLPRGFLNKRPDRAPMIPAGFLLHLKGEKRGDVLGRVRIMAPNRLPTDRLKEHRALHVISLFAFALPPSLSLSPADLMHAGMSAQSQHFHKRTNERRNEEGGMIIRLHPNPNSYFDAKCPFPIRRRVRGVRSFGVRVSMLFLGAPYSLLLPGWNFAVPQQPDFERRSSRVTALCIAEQSWNISWASN